jgi:hypothetical protein
VASRVRVFQEFRKGRELTDPDDIEHAVKVSAALLRYGGMSVQVVG